MNVRFNHARRGRHRDFYGFLNDSLDVALADGSVHEYVCRDDWWVSFKKRTKLNLMAKVVAVTTCEIEDEDRNVLARGFAFCSYADQFSRPKGRAIAEGRARARLEER